MPSPTPAQQFAQLFQQPDATPELLALAIARIAYPDLDVEPVLGQFDALASFVRGEELANPTGGLTAVRFLQVICRELDFHGNREAYYDPSNSLLPDVLATRMGLPIMLCLVCMAIGRRLDVRIDGLGFPSHFMALYHAPAGSQEGDTVIDPFWGVTLEPGSVEQHLARLLGQPQPLAPQDWEPVTAQAMALRILANLRHAYLTVKDLAKAAGVLDFLIAVQPGEAQHWRERGLIHYRQGCWEQTQHDLRRYLLRIGLLATLVETPARSAKAAGAEADVNPGDRRVLAIYREAGAMLSRIN